MEIDKTALEKIFDQFKQKSRDLVRKKTPKIEDKISFISSLRAITVDLTLHEYVDILDKREISVLYLAKNLLNDVFRNLAMDASFGFEEVENEAGEFANSLAQFIYFTLNETSKDYTKALNALFESIRKYQKALASIEKKAEENIISR